MESGLEGKTIVAIVGRKSILTEKGEKTKREEYKEGIKRRLDRT